MSDEKRIAEISDQIAALREEKAALKVQQRAEYSAMRLRQKAEQIASRLPEGVRDAVIEAVTAQANAAAEKPEGGE